jgi:hypothetical protein
MKSVSKTSAPKPPRTLLHAHAELVRIRPARDASSAAWLYEHIAEIDPGHELEALYWAQRERIRARNIADQIRAQATGE